MCGRWTVSGNVNGGIENNGKKKKRENIFLYSLFHIIKNVMYSGGG